jgi:hypothetical protein
MQCNFSGQRLLAAFASEVKRLCPCMFNKATRKEMRLRFGQSDSEAASGVRQENLMKGTCLMAEHKGQWGRALLLPLAQPLL